MNLITGIDVQKKNISINTGLHNPQIKDNHFTILIGPNGSGKTRLLNEIINMSDYGLEDKTDGFPNSSRVMSDYPMSELRVLAFSSSPSDKFPIKKRLKPKMKANSLKGAEYIYIGTKDANRSFRQKLLSIISDIAIELKTNRLKNLRYHNFLSHLDLDSNIKISFGSNYLDQLIYLDSNASKLSGKNILKEIIEDQKNRPRRFKIKTNDDFLRTVKFNKTPNLKSIFKNYPEDANRINVAFSRPFFKDEELHILESFFDKLQKNKNNGKFQIHYDLNFNELHASDSFADDLPALQILKKKRMINPSGISLLKKGENTNFDLWNSSSGEVMLIYFFFSLIFNFKERTVVLIDEPEVSLHPNWQMDFVYLLKSVVKDFHEYQFIIATHSPHIVANCPQATTTALRLRQNNGHITASLISPESGGWSVESILYNVFGCSEAGNKYFERDLQKLLNLVSAKSAEKTEIENLLLSLKKLSLRPDDPVLQIITEVEKYLKDL